MLPVATRDRLAVMDYRYEELRALMLAQDWTTVAVVWREADDRWHARNPFPVGGVVEDPATGAAAAALGGYLRDAGVVGAPTELTVLQGHDMGRPSTMRALQLTTPDARGRRRRASGETRTPTAVRPRGPKPRASASSATLACAPRVGAARHAPCAQAHT